MQGKPTLLERAFELADSGISARAIRDKLHHEGYDVNQLVGSALRADLMRRGARARKGAESNAEQ